jgi:hypothetical protein
VDNLSTRKFLHRIHKRKGIAGGKNHAKKDRRANAKNDLRDADVGLAGAHPWCAHHRLACAFHNFTALVGFVLHTPLAYLLAEG